MKTNQSFSLTLSVLGCTMLLFAISCKPTDAETASEEVKPPEQIISKKQASVLFEEYTRQRVPCAIAAVDSTAKAEFVPARYTEFDFQVIKEYVAYIEQEARAAKKDIKSLRVYYAVYPPDRDEDANKTTVFLVPSAEFNGENRAFEIDRSGEGATAVPIPWDFGTGVKQLGMYPLPEERHYAGIGFAPFTATAATVQPGGSLILNDGNTAPPPYN